MINKLKNSVKNSSSIWKLRCFLSLKLFGSNKVKMKGVNNLFNASSALLKKTDIQVFGNDNCLLLGKGVRFEGVIKIYGNNNSIEIHDNCFIKGAKFWIEDDKNKIEIGRYSTVEENTEFATIEGCNIIIGEDCMISSDVTIRTGDSHSILNDEGIRINSSKNIEVGNHVWIGNKAVLTKGSLVSDNSIVGSGALVNKAFQIKNCIVAGLPAKVIKDQISWLRERI